MTRKQIESKEYLLLKYDLTLVILQPKIRGSLIRLVFDLWGLLWEESCGCILSHERPRVCQGLQKTTYHIC